MFVTRWHTASSDCDVIALYILPPAALCSLSPPKKSLSVSFTTDGEVEVSVTAYEIRHACSMLAGHNPTLWEAVRSPIVYRDEVGCAARCRSAYLYTCNHIL